MKVLIIALIAAFLFVGCEKKQEVPVCFKVKIIGKVCGNNVFQILDPAYEHLGVDNWYDGISGNTYNNVFTQQNFCNEIAGDANKEAMVSLATESSNLACFTCLALYPSPMPSVKLAIAPCAN